METIKQALKEEGVPRELSDSEIEKLLSDQCISTFQRNKLEREAKKNWDLFYKRNKNNFFKDRHWTTREFTELLTDQTIDEEKQISNKVLLEVGCGVGNFIFPLIETGCKYFFLACDFSPVAIDILKRNPLYNEEKCKAFVADITDKSTFVNSIDSFGYIGNIDIISLVFVLSAISPDKMSNAVDNLFEVLRPGGIVLFRDYGIFDHAMIRFSEGHKISDNFYVRQDGTRAFYFTKKNVMELFTKSGFQMISNEFVRKETVNKKEGISVPRIFIQSKFCKPKDL
ncbi:methyltransferase-like protein 6 [Tetranychus urticae]|uniref:tRNA N(3)-methylcytidine methyltransferase n=1 Tax=Tetranychus urticae TaxID=32264 RepID=T1KD30_TETUR|nr:methyltransferase-like protein 6 [Tetranychus urticae]XP_025016785.1 methyltransferase-like protein 6 [Tetranychus urticae]